ncbi:MAG: universal stress protein [Pseudomonadota bacterium]
MYKRILIPTDGSDASNRAIGAGMQLAKSLHAEVVALTVIPNYHILSLAADQLEHTPGEFESEGRLLAQRRLQQVSQSADEAGVPCSCEIVTSDHPYEAIVDTARERDCDLINMASHGHRGVKGLLLGSETQKVLTHSAIPVLVHR